MSWIPFAILGWILMTLGFISLTASQVAIAQMMMVGGFSAFLVSFVEAARHLIRGWHGKKGGR